MISDRASFGYSRYWLHKHQAVIQFDRVQLALHERSLAGEWLQEPNAEEARLWFHFGKVINQKILAEVHMFFIALDNVKDMMNVILSNDTLKHLKKNVGAFINDLEHYTHGRNTFEHYDDRIPGGAKHLKVEQVKSDENCGARRILGGLRGSTYLFGDKEWELTPEKFQEAINGMNGFEKTLHQYLDEQNA